MHVSGGTIRIAYSLWDARRFSRSSHEIYLGTTRDQENITCWVMRRSSHKNCLQLIMYNGQWTTNNRQNHIRSWAKNQFITPKHHVFWKKKVQTKIKNMLYLTINIYPSACFKLHHQAWLYLQLAAMSVKTWIRS